jgi:hypothetical protein
MTTKPKPRKGAAKAAPVKSARSQKSFETDDDRVRKIDSTYEKLRGLLSVHDCELDMLSNRLAELRNTSTLRNMRALIGYLHILSRKD